MDRLNMEFTRVHVYQKFFDIQRSPFQSEIEKSKWVLALFTKDQVTMHKLTELFTNSGIQFITWGNL